jgi:hypothetical protein
MFRSAILFFGLLLLPARANLGETVEQCVARYGHPIGYSEASAKSPFGTVAFSATGYTLIVFLLNTREVGARVSKQDKSAFTDGEMATIMNADAGATAWTLTPSTDPTCLQWARADHATVLYDKDKHVLIFTSAEMLAALHLATPKPSAGN